MNDYQHYITKNIRAFYKKRLFSPIIYLFLLFLLWMAFPFSDMLHPTEFTAASLTGSSADKSPYIYTTLTDLNFTGYTQEKRGKTFGYYYYTSFGEQVLVVLLSPSTCEQGLSQIDSISFSGKIMSSSKSYQTLLENISLELQWTKEGIMGQLPKYYLSEPDFGGTAMRLFFLFYFGTMLYSTFCLLFYLLYILFPVLSPPCQNLVVFGNPRKLLEEAEEELATLPQLATEDMFITEHYFIETSQYGNAIVPIKEILWIYKYSTLHKFLWYHFSITYTLHITAKRHFYIHCPKNTKSNIDGIIDYLSEANHEILVGFNEKNRLKVQAVLGKPFHIEKLVAFFRKSPATTSESGDFPQPSGDASLSSESRWSSETSWESDEDHWASGASWESDEARQASDATLESDEARQASDATLESDEARQTSEATSESGKSRQSK